MTTLKMPKAVINFSLKCSVIYFSVLPIVYGVELSADLYSGLEYTNNAKFATTATIEDVSQTLGLNVLLKEQRKRFNVDASFNVEEEHYYNNTYTNQTSLTTGFGIFNFDIIENFLDWRTSFTRTETLRSSLSKNTPNNRARRNILRSGPNVTYRINRASTLGFSANYISVENSAPQTADTKRADGNVAYNYALNSATSFSINGKYDEVIGGARASGLKNINVNLGVIRAFSHGEMSFNYGRTQSRSSLSNTVAGNFYNLSFIRQQLFWHDISLQYTQDISDTSIGFKSSEQGSLLGGGGTPVNSNGGSNIGGNSLGVVTGLDILKKRQFNVSISRVIESYQYNVSGFWSDLNYKVQHNDERSYGLSLQLSRNISSSLSAGILYSHSIDDFLDRPAFGKETTNTYRLNGGYVLSKKLDMSTYIQFEGREDDRYQIREYEEFSTGVTLKWAIL